VWFAALMLGIGIADRKQAIFIFQSSIFQRRLLQMAFSVQLRCLQIFDLPLTVRITDYAMPVSCDNLIFFDPPKITGMQ
jgi:hypothetical protein